MKNKIIIITIIMCLIVGLCVGIQVIRNKKNVENIEVVEENTINENDIAENEEIIEDTDVKEVIDEENQDNDNVELKEESKIEIQQQEKVVTNKNTTQVKNNNENTKKEVVTEKVKEETKVNTENKSTLIQEKNVNKVTENTETKVETIETKKEVKEPEKPQCTDTKHGVGVGNSNRWFNSKQEAINHYQSIIKNWGDKWENFEIDDETYNKNCPYGYEIWSCQFCGKWTINFYYN